MCITSNMPQKHTINFASHHRKQDLCANYYQTLLAWQLPATELVTTNPQCGQTDGFAKVAHPTLQFDGINQPIKKYYAETSRSPLAGG